MNNLIQLYTQEGISYPKFVVDGFVDASAEGEDAFKEYIYGSVEEENCTGNQYSGPVVKKGHDEMAAIDRSGAVGNGMSYLSGDNEYVPFDSSMFFKSSNGSASSLKMNISGDQFTFGSNGLSFVRYGDISDVIDMRNSTTDASCQSFTHNHGFIMIGDTPTMGQQTTTFTRVGADGIIAAANGDVSIGNSANNSTTKYYVIGTDETQGTSSLYRSVSDTVGDPKSIYFKNFTLYQTSDDRLKDYISDVSVNLDDISSIMKKRFTWKDSTDGGVEIGVSAQSLQKVFPELVSENDGYLSVSYEKLSVIALAAIDALNQKVEMLERRISEFDGNTSGRKQSELFRV